ncbi:MAG: hypothetical protein JWO36_6278 [Myxococcales bacterium]|nr:hypothetical protein [Myxococcales bacterium]
MPFCDIAAVKRAVPVAIVILVGIVFAMWLRHRGDSGATETAGDHRRAATQPMTAADRGSAASDSSDPASTLADDDPRGALRLEGQVLDAQDHPVAGAIVTLSSNPPRTAKTEQDGGFFFDGLVGRPYTLVARASAGVAGPVTARLGETTDPIVLRLRAGAKLAVTVVGSNARPIDGASVELRGADHQTAATAAGVARFDPVVPGTYDVVASAPGMAKAHTSVRVAGATTTRLVLTAGAPVTGRVVDEHGAPVPGARVGYVSSSELRGTPDAVDGVVSAGDGSWRFIALPAGSFRFVANDDEHAPGTSSLVTLDGATEKTGVVVTMSPGAVVRGRVVDTTKQPVAGARVRIASTGRGARGGPRQSGRQTYSDARGEFAIRGLVRAPLFATASHEKGASSGAEVDTTSGDANVVITLDLTAVIAGTVVDPEGQPIESAQVTAFPQLGGGPQLGARGRGGPNVELTDASGKFRIGGLAPGAYTVHASRTATTRGFGGRGRRGDGVDAETGNENVRIVLPAEGGIKGTVAFADGTTPLAITVSVGSVEQAFVTGAFELSAIAPGDYTLQVRGPSFDAHQQDVTIQAGKPTDVGTITVAAGRRIAGVVVLAGQPVAGATVYAGRQVMGNGSTNAAPAGGFGAGGGSPGSKQDTTDGSGAFALAGFGDGDLAVIADLPGAGRSTPLLVADTATNQTSLLLELQPYGSLSGVLRQGGQPVGGIAVTVQSTSTPGAVYVVTAGSDGAYRFDQLAPDTYKVSATVGNMRSGMHLYSQQVAVPPGKEVRVDLVVDQGTVTLDATPVVANGQPGIAIAYLATTAITATTASELSRQLAAAGPGSSQMTIVRPGETGAFTEVTPGSDTVCMVPLPIELRGGAAIGYFDRHSSKLPAFCKPVVVAASPDTQQVQVTVQVPALIPDPQTTGNGRGSGR